MTSTVCENQGTVEREGVYTRLVFIAMGTSECLALVKPDADLEDTFKAFDVDENEWLTVKGWLCEVNDYEA